MPDKRRVHIPEQLNPFGDAAFGSPWSQIQADVPSINDAAFRSVLSELAQVRMGAKASSIVITGEPGSGKTHLLGRLRNALPPDTAFIYVRCHASGATLWRHVRTAVASDLLKRDGGLSRLQRVLQQNPERLDTIESLTLRRVLESYREGRHVLAASAWLRGEALPDSDLAALNIAVEKDEEERSRETEAKDAVDGMLRLLAPDPTVLCFDQVETLETYRGDAEGFNTMAKLISHLRDSENHGHVLLVSCLVSAFEALFDRLPNQAERARWLQRKITLKPIPWDAAMELVKGRLDSSPALSILKQEHPQDPLWPLDAADLRPLFENTGLCLPRTLIQTCKTRFESLFGPATDAGPKISREDFLKNEYARNFNDARSVVARQGADKILAESLPWLMQNSGFTPLGPNHGNLPGANLVFRGENGNLGVVLCSAGGVRMTNQLRKVHQHWDPKAVGLRVIRDAAKKPGARGEEFLRSIKSKGAQEVYPLAEALAALQAIHNMIAAARSGDLTQDGHGINETEVSGWSLRNLAPHLIKLREDLIGPKAPPDSTLPKLAALLSERKVVEAGVAAGELSITVEEVSACAHRHPMRFGLLAGPPLVLFEAVEGAAPELSRA